jgi:hypothetical protein
MRPCYPEPTLSEVLSDPLILSVMKADRVDVSSLEKSLLETSAKIRGFAPRQSCTSQWIAWS